MVNQVDIQVKRTGSEGLEFRVKVREGGSETRHRVTLAEATYQKLSAGRFSPEDLLVAAFRFLLDRESKESILASFDVEVISRYFPSFEKELPDYLSD